MFRKRFAFTLAETLITLVIIGIVAAITIPTIQVQHQKKQTITLLKKAFSDISRAVLLARSQFGDPQYWDYTLNNHEFFDEYLYPFIQLSSQKISDAKKDNIIYYQSSGKVENGLLIMRDQGEIVELISGCQIFTYPLAYSSGTSVQRKCYAIDINGYKKPNKFGRDLFMFCIDGQKGVVPHSWDDQEVVVSVKTREKLMNGPSSYSYQCNKQGRGMWCAALIMADHWQIKDDYPL